MIGAIGTAKFDNCGYCACRRVVVHYLRYAPARYNSGRSIRATASPTGDELLSCTNC